SRRNFVLARITRGIGTRYCREARGDQTGSERADRDHCRLDQNRSTQSRIGFRIPHSPFRNPVNFSHFFIDRPIFAGVISIVITLVGVIALSTLPIAQYPEIAPPTIQVTATYPGANAKVVSETVATPIEQQVNGVENMLYMSSQSTSDGNMTLSITFKLGTNLDTAQVLVQNRVAIAIPVLPPDVQRIGVT